MAQNSWVLNNWLKDVSPEIENPQLAGEPGELKSQSSSAQSSKHSTTRDDPGFRRPPAGHTPPIEADEGVGHLVVHSDEDEDEEFRVLALQRGASNYHDVRRRQKEREQEEAQGEGRRHLDRERERSGDGRGSSNQYSDVSSAHHRRQPSSSPTELGRGSPYHHPTTGVQPDGLPLGPNHYAHAGSAGHYGMMHGGYMNRSTSAVDPQYMHQRYQGYPAPHQMHMNTLPHPHMARTASLPPEFQPNHLLSPGQYYPQPYGYAPSPQPMMMQNSRQMYSSMAPGSFHGGPQHPPFMPTATQTPNRHQLANHQHPKIYGRLLKKGRMTGRFVERMFWIHNNILVYMPSGEEETVPVLIIDHKTTISGPVSKSKYHSFSIENGTGDKVTLYSKVREECILWIRSIQQLSDQLKAEMPLEEEQEQGSGGSADVVNIKIRDSSEALK